MTIVPTLADLRAFADANGLGALTDDELTARLAQGSSNAANKLDTLLRGFFPELTE